MKNILLIQPLGSICLNQNLAAIVKMLSQNMYHVDIVSMKVDEYAQNWNYPNSNMVLWDLGLSHHHNNEMMKVLKCDYSLVIGVDQGIVPAASYADKFSIPLAFISYEIFFADEIGYEEKRAEIQACENISFAVCQDAVRRYFLAKEYGIQLDRILCIPVADGYESEIKDTGFLRRHLNIDKDAKIALFSGSIGERA